MGVGTGRAKLLLLGEHAAVHGHVAVGRTLPWSLTVTHVPGATWNLSSGGPYEAPVLRVLGRLSELAAERGWPAPVPGTIEARADMAPSGGFGSSAALCAALVQALFPGLGADAKDELAWRAEFVFHGTPSGIDTALALRQGWWALEPGVAGTSPARPRPLPDPGLVLVTGSVERQSDTKALVASVSARLQAGDRAALGAIERLGGLAREAVARIESGHDLASLVAAARGELQDLGLETPDLTAAIDAGLACEGALAGKLSGAGGGGAFFLMFREAASARAALERIRAALPNHRWKVAPTLIP